MTERRKVHTSDAFAASASALIPASSLSRRSFLGGLGTSVGTAALQACNKAPPEKIIPYVKRPPEVVPGVGRYYATCTTRGGYAVGLLVESHAGRPTKIEGHPDHPASLGKTLVQEQAELLTLYDPDRAKTFRQGSQARSWSAFLRKFATTSAQRNEPRAKRPEILLLEPTASPLVAWLLERVREARPELRIYFDALAAPLQRWQAARDLFGEVLEPQYRFERAEVVLALDANFLAAMPMSIRYARDFASLRDVRHPQGFMNRLYAAESSVSVTGATAEHRLALAPSEVGQLAAGILHALAEDQAVALPDATRAEARRLWRLLTEREQNWAQVVARDLARRRGKSLVVVGEQQPSTVHALGMALNEMLGNVGHTVSYSASPLLEAGTQAFELTSLLDTLDSGEVHTAFVLGPNPAYTWPSALLFAERLRKARERVHLSLYENETARHASWFLPATHFLESWGDARAYDGTVSLRQPLIRPLYDGKSVEEALAGLAGIAAVGGHDLLQKRFLNEKRSEAEWQRSVRGGIVHGSAFAPKLPVLEPARLTEALRSLSAAHSKHRLELETKPDPRVEDGHLTNNRWLLELPEPISKLVWDNAALLAPDTADELGVSRGDIIEISKGQSSVRAPVLVSPGQSPKTVTMWLGWGREGEETAASGIGVNLAPLRERDNPWLTSGVEVRATGQQYHLVTTQEEYSQHDRELLLYKTRHEWQKQPGFAQKHAEPPPSLMPKRLADAPQWGMTVDLGRCTGCSTCVIACQAENNVPTVGKEMVAMGREMHWLRIDTYREGTESDPKLLMQPMLCQHCERAPCEYVCPVNATLHSNDGLNEMVYNRCVGTRFCSNNCPYKVRRFNYYEWNQNHPEVRKMAFNPDVTVRARGVMEKCSYCVQRIRRAQIDAKLEARPLRDGDVRTACQQACPTDAIVFGSITDPQSQVSQSYRNPRTYAVLNELGTLPRTRYLARIDNTNPELDR